MMNRIRRAADKAIPVAAVARPQVTSSHRLATVATGKFSSAARLRIAFAITILMAGLSLSLAEEITFTHGPILGRQSSNSMRVWTRTSKPSRFVVRYGISPGKLDSLSALSQTQLARDNTGVAEIRGLLPNTKYYYQLATDEGAAGPAGTFRTLPDCKTMRDAKLNPRGLFNFKFEFACGNNQDPAHGIGPSLPTYDSLLAKVKDDVDFAILNGDWLYEEDRDYSPAKWRQQVGVSADQVPQLVRTAPNIVGVWENYKTYLSRGKNLSEWHRHVPSYFTFDDHEILNDVFGSGTPGYRNRRAVFRDIAIQAWYDYLGWSNPVRFSQPIHFGRASFKAGSDVLTDSNADFTKINFNQSANLHVHWGTADAGVKDIDAGDVEGGDANANVYGVVKVIDQHHLKMTPAAKADGTASYSIGRRSYGNFRVANCEFYLCDTRTHRQLHDIKQPDKPGLSMLGKHQRDWLMDEMKNSDADFHFVVSSVNFMIPHVGGGGAGFDAGTKDDAWTVFLDERETLINFWDKLDARVFVLTGDLHNSFAIKITDNVWEFASGPHNSVNHRPIDEGNRRPNGRFKYGPRECEIRWSTVALQDIPRLNRLFPRYCVVQINNVFNNPIERGGTRWVEFPRPQVIFQYYDGFTGKLSYAESILAAGNKNRQ